MAEEGDWQRVASRADIKQDTAFAAQLGDDPIALTEFEGRVYAINDTCTHEFALLSEGFSWAGTDSARKSVLSDAINRRLVLTNPVPNPKSPQFPVTAIRLNRLMPEVKTILGNGGETMPDFHPVQIRGENLSATILRDRR